MNAENITAGALFGESLEERIDDNSNCLYLKRLNRIEIKQNGKSVLYSYRTEFFMNPPTSEVQLMREILELLGIELISREDFQSSPSVTVKVSEKTQLIQVESGFWSKWLIVFGIIPCGAIKESGNFWDRGADIIIDIPRDSH